MAPPWSPVPWHVLALMEEAVRRGAGARSRPRRRSGAACRGSTWRATRRPRRRWPRSSTASPGRPMSRQRLKRFVTADEAQTPLGRAQAVTPSAGPLPRDQRALPARASGRTRAVTLDGVPRLHLSDRGRHASTASPSRSAPTSRASTRARRPAGGHRPRSSASRSSCASTASCASRWASRPAEGDRADIPVCRYVVVGADGDRRRGGRRATRCRAAGSSSTSRAGSSPARTPRSSRSRSATTRSTPRWPRRSFGLIPPVR